MVIRKVRAKLAKVDFFETDGSEHVFRSWGPRKHVRAKTSFRNFPREIPRLRAVVIRKVRAKLAKVDFFETDGSKHVFRSWGPRKHVRAKTSFRNFPCEIPRLRAVLIRKVRAKLAKVDFSKRMVPSMFLGHGDPENMFARKLVSGTFHCEIPRLRAVLIRKVRAKLAKIDFSKRMVPSMFLGHGDPENMFARNLVSGTFLVKFPACAQCSFEKFVQNSRKFIFRNGWLLACF